MGASAGAAAVAGRRTGSGRRAGLRSGWRLGGGLSSRGLGAAAGAAGVSGCLLQPARRTRPIRPMARILPGTNDVPLEAFCVRLCSIIMNSLRLSFVISTVCVNFTWSRTTMSVDSKHITRGVRSAHD